MVYLHNAYDSNNMFVILGLISDDFILLDNQCISTIKTLKIHWHYTYNSSMKGRVIYFVGYSEKGSVVYIYYYIDLTI